MSIINGFEAVPKHYCKVILDYIKRRSRIDSLADYKGSEELFLDQITVKALRAATTSGYRLL